MKLLYTLLLASSMLSAQESTLFDQAQKGASISVASILQLLKIDLPGGIKDVLSKVMIDKPTIKTGADGAKMIEGGGSLLGQQVAFRFSALGGKLSLSAGLSSGIDFAKIDPKLKPLNLLKIEKSAFILSTGSFVDPQWNVPVSQGANFVATVAVTGKLAQLLKALGKDLNEVTFSGAISPQITGSKFSVQLPGELKLGPLGNSTGLTLSMYLIEVVAGVPDVAFSATSGLKIILPSQKEPISMNGEFLITPAPPKLRITGYMDGIYKPAFDIPGLGLGNFGFGVDSDLTTLASTGGTIPITGGCLKGTLAIGPKVLDVAGCLDVSASPIFMLKSKLEGGLYLIDFVKFGSIIVEEAAATAGAKLDLFTAIKKQIPNIGVKTFIVDIIPQAATFAGVAYDKGVLVEMTTDILGKEASLDFKIDMSGMNALGFIESFNVGPFKLSGTMKNAAGKEGAGVKMIIDPKKLLATLAVDGTVELNVLGGLKGATIINLSPTGLSFMLETKILNQFDAKINVKADVAVSPSAAAPTGKAEMSEDAKKVAAAAPQADPSSAKNYSIRAELTQSGLKKLGEILQKAATEMLDNAKKELDKQKDKVNSLDKQKADLDQQIAAVNEKDAALNRANQASIDAALQTVNAEKVKKEKLDAAIAKCKGKKPKVDVEKFAKGTPLTKQQIDQQMEQFKKANPNLTDQQLAAIRKNLAA